MALVPTQDASKMDGLKKHITESECICIGNWRRIIADSEPLFGKAFGRDEILYSFIGVAHAEDDYYYIMKAQDGYHYWFSCVGSLEQLGFKQK